jgi:hypothetical protein
MTEGVTVALWGAAAVGAALGLFCVAGNRFVRRRWEQAKARRPGEGFSEFRESFHGHLSEEGLWEVYSFFQHWAGDPGFPVRRTDSLAGLYGIVEDDVGRMVETLAARTDQAPPADWTRAQLRTVGDVALLVVGAGSPPSRGEPR